MAAVGAAGNGDRVVVAAGTYSEDFDVGFQASRMAESRFEVEPIADDVVFPVCSPELAARLPARPGGSMATIVDVAAREHQLRRAGISAAARLDARLMTEMNES